MEEVGALLAESTEFQVHLRGYFQDQIKRLKEIDEKEPKGSEKTFQQKLDEALAKLKE